MRLKGLKSVLFSFDGKRWFSFKVEPAEDSEKDSENIGRKGEEHERNNND